MHIFLISILPNYILPDIYHNHFPFLYLYRYGTFERNWYVVIMRPSLLGVRKSKRDSALLFLYLRQNYTYLTNTTHLNVTWAFRNFYFYIIREATEVCIRKPKWLCCLDTGITYNWPLTSNIPIYHLYKYRNQLTWLKTDRDRIFFYNL